MEAREREAREPQLFQECKIGVGNANVLTKALAMATPEMLRDTVIVVRVVVRGFHGKCTVSQELISAQIPWASAGAERSRSAKDREHERERARKVSASSINPNGNGSLSDLAIPVLTREEQLLADLLSANKQLLAALKLYTDLCRTAAEREVKLKNLYILPDGDIPRLFQVCKMGMDNASILGRVLANATPMQLTDPVIVVNLHTPLSIFPISHSRMATCRTSTRDAQTRGNSSTRRSRWRPRPHITVATRHIRTCWRTYCQRASS
ncbi:hypothetical protein B0H14DRAFT_2385675 [Mycena olivaceomarginata]|nr:hypothetical protein B0H14DRAFT_2385675 [Mycena olivaceomarginata]